MEMRAALKVTERISAASHLVDEGTLEHLSNDLCEAGQRLFDSANQRSRAVEATRYPRWKLALGGSVGFTPHKYLQQGQGDDGMPLVVDELDAAGMPTGETLPQLSEVKKTYGSARAGMSGAFLPVSYPGAKYARTWEARFLYEYITEAQSTSAQWCETKGVVGDMSSSPRANACRSLVVGKPSATHKLLLDAYVGFVDVANGLYRVAIGPRLTWSNPEGDADPTRTVGVRVPFSLNLLAAPRNEQKLDYDGLIRVTPYYEASWTGDEDTVHSGGLVLELLGKRSLFSTKYDEL
jgi:hypothetical protein